MEQKCFKEYTKNFISKYGSQLTRLTIYVVLYIIYIENLLNYGNVFVIIVLSYLYIPIILYELNRETTYSTLFMLKMYSIIILSFIGGIYLNYLNTSQITIIEVLENILKTVKIKYAFEIVILIFTLTIPTIPMFKILDELIDKSRNERG